VDTSRLKRPADTVRRVHPLRRFVNDYQWVHTGIGIVGNLLFFVGSVLFLWESTKAMGVWLFIAGAGFMLVGAVGSAIVKLGPVQRHAGNGS
jgi:hypothetical protein